MASSNKKPQLIESGTAVDERGRLTFVNDFNFPGVKRFYMVENASTDIIRAFHGHLKEEKFVFVVAGAALVAAVAIDDPKKPSTSNEVHRFTLKAEEPAILYIPAGYANGFRALEEGTKVIFFSTATLEESKEDDYRFPHDYWGKEVWEI